jgi:hypothetical protein
MAPQEKQLLEMEAAFPKMAGAAFANAYKRALASGHSVLRSEHGAIYEVFPDGRRKLVKKIAPPSSIKPGTKFSLR